VLLERTAVASAVLVAQLIFASSLLICFGCNSDLELQEKLAADKCDTKFDLVNHIRDQVMPTSLSLRQKDLSLLT
jgi:hypothetical protein